MSDNLSDVLLEYDKAAENWNEALPIGNGRFGAMIFGKVDDELLQLNEDSAWSGKFRERNNPKAISHLDEIRQLIKDGHVTKAEEVYCDAFYGTNEQQRHYMPLGDLHIWQNIGEHSDYRRSLDLVHGASTVQFTANGVRYSRKMFASYPDSVMAICFNADKPGNISFTSVIDGRDDNYDKNEKYDDNTIIFTVSDGIGYSVAITVVGVGGKCGVDANRIYAEGCDSAVILLSAQTEFRTADHLNLAVSQTKRAARIVSINGAEALYERHAADFSAMMNRSNIEICDNSDEKSSLTTDKRLENIRNGGNDNTLAVLYWNFSKYLMISGSREGSLPLNLQGIWNKDMWPAWGGKYTININTEMNYWAAEAQQLGDCCEPLFTHIERMREHGRVTARKMYGCRGTVCHHNTDIWGDCAPQDKWIPATLWPMGLAWLSLHIYEHYLYTGDVEFLADKYDTFCEIAEFFVDYLTENENGELITSPSVSPENTYVTKSGEKGSVCAGPSMDSQILHTLFADIISASEIIGAKNTEFVDKIREIKERLPKPQIGKYGQIMEWAEDYDEVEPGHRHISQLFALYPSNLITVEDTPELAAAARATIERRLSHGGGHTGWSRAWIINMWARLHDGEKVGENIRSLLAHSTAISMLDMHPPFQIDGNFGGGAGITEAVMQSHSGVIRFVPALPPEWKNGKAENLRARGGFDVSFEWADNAFASGSIVSQNGGLCRVKGEFEITTGGTVIKGVYENGVTSFDTVKGKKYLLSRV